MATKSKPVAIKEDEKWRVESDMRTLMEAEVIKKDAKRYAKARELAREKIVEIASVATGDSE